MEPRKRKISVTLDAALLTELEQGEGSVSAQLNDALRREIDRRRGRTGLRAFLDELAAERGPLDTPEDLAEMERIEEVWRRIDATPLPGERAS